MAQKFIFFFTAKWIIGIFERPQADIKEILFCSGMFEEPHVPTRAAVVSTLQ